MQLNIELAKNEMMHESQYEMNEDTAKHVVLSTGPNT